MSGSGCLIQGLTVRIKKSKLKPPNFMCFLAKHPKVQKLKGTLYSAQAVNSILILNKTMGFY